MRSRTVALSIVLVAAVAVLAARVWWYWPFFEDDSFISLRYAQRLLHGHGLTWTDGPRVEGYSNLLWILACAAVGRAGVDLVTAARLLGIGLSIGTLVVLVMYQLTDPFRRRPQAAFAAVTFAALALAGSDTFGAWAAAGLEQPLLAFLIAFAVVLLTRSPDSVRGRLAAGMFLALSVLTRPDAMLFVVAIAFGFVVSQRNLLGIVRAAWCIALPVTAYLCQLIFRVAYYGDWVPNTARVKMVVSASHLVEGLHYVAQGCLYELPLILTLPVALYLAVRSDPVTRERLLIPALPAIAWLGYLVVIGGDIFPAHRHFEVPLVLCAFSAMDVLTLAFSQLRWNVARQWVACGVLTVSLAGLQAIDPAGFDAKKEGWEWDMKTIGQFMKSAFGSKSPLLAVDAAGALPYYSELPAVDMLGLNDQWIATHRPVELGSGRAGHELGDGKYVLSRHPDFVFVNTPRKSQGFYFRSEIEMSQEPEFKRDYRFLNFDPGGPFIVTTRMWARLTSPLIGIHMTARGIEIPGMFFASNPFALASLDDHGVVATHIPAGREGRLPGVWIPAGTWRVETDARGPVVVDIDSSDDGVDTKTTTGTVSTEHGGFINIRLMAGRSEAVVRSVTLVPVSGG